MPLLLVEHLNMSVADEKASFDFYNALGCVLVTGRDNKTMHVNCGGMTQFHLPHDDGRRDLWKGEIEMGYGNQEELTNTLAKLVALQYKPEQVLGSETSRVVGPNGNLFVLKHIDKSINIPGTKRLTADAPDCWLQSVVVEVPTGSTSKISKFYKTVFHIPDQQTGVCPVSRLPFISILTAYGQAITFKESHAPKQSSDCEHIAIYISDFESVFDNALEKNLIFVNERFAHLDWATTKEEALGCNQFRVIDIVDEDGNTIVKLEHEIRNTSHPSCPIPI